MQGLIKQILQSLHLRLNRIFVRRMNRMETDRISFRTLCEIDAEMLLHQRRFYQARPFRLRLF